MEDIPGENLITSSVEQNEEYNDVLNTSPCDSNVVKVPGIVSDVTEQDDSPHSLDEDNDLSSCQREVARVHDSTSNISEQRDRARLQVEQNEEYNDVLNTSPCDSNVVKVPGIVSDVTEQDDSPHSLDEDNDLSSCQREVARVHDSTSNISEQRDRARLQVEQNEEYNDVLNTSPCDSNVVKVPGIVSDVTEQDDSPHSLDEDNDLSSCQREVARVHDSTSNISGQRDSARLQVEQNEEYNDVLNTSPCDSNVVKVPGIVSDVTEQDDSPHSLDEDNDLSSCQREVARVHDSTSNISEQRDSARLQVEQNEEYNDVLNTSPCDSNVVKVPGIVSDVTEQDDSPHSLDEDNDLSSCQREVARVHDSTSNISEQRDSARLQDKNEGGNLYTLAKEREFSLMPKNTHDKDINECPVERLNIGPVPPEENDRMVETMHREKDNKSNEIPQLQNDASTQTEAENQEMETTNKNLQAKIVRMKQIFIQKEERNRGLQNTNKSLQGTIDWMKTVSKLHKEKFFRQQRISYECGKHETLKQVRILEQENKNLLKKAENKDAENKNLQATIDIMKDMSKRQSDDVLRIKHEDMKKRSLLESTQIQNDLYTEQNKQYVAEIGELQKQIKICDLRNMILEEALQEFGNSENRLMAENIVLKKELKDMRKELIHYQEKMQRQQRIIHQSGKRETLEQMHILGQSNENLLKEAKNKDEIITTQKHQIQQCKSDFKGVCKTNHRYLQQIADMAASIQTYRETTEECCQKLKL